MGNCGVGFAPAKTDKHDWLINLMEGVEDIPGAALAEGIDWQWETFPEYLDALDKMPRALDVATQIPHGAVRAYVMGQRGADNEAATPEDIEKMADIVEDGIKAGALGFSTSRTMLHLSKDGEPCPAPSPIRTNFWALPMACSAAVMACLKWLPTSILPKKSLAGWPKCRKKPACVTYALLQNPMDKDSWRTLLQMTEDAVADGANIKAQIALRARPHSRLGKHGASLLAAP